MEKKRSYTLHYYAAVVIGYILLGLLIPLNSSMRDAYNLNQFQAHIIGFIAIVPVFGIWFAGFFCYSKLQLYALSIRKSNEGQAFKKIADGVMILSWGLVIQSYLSLIAGSINPSNSGLHTGFVVLQNYLTLLFPLIALPLIGSGTRKLGELKKQRPSLGSIRFMILLSSTLGAVYSFLIFHLRHDQGIYQLPTILLLATIVIPYLYAWCCGLLAATEIHVYASSTNGILYKHGLNFLSLGLIILIVTSIALQYLNSAFLSNLGSFSLNIVLLIDYLLLAGMAVGYILMISGARRLQTIEEV